MTRLKHHDDQRLSEPLRRTTSGAEARDWQRVHRSLVHKHSGEQVVLRRFRAGKDCELEIDIRGARNRLESMLDDAGFVAETLRQSTIALGHLRYGVASDSAFLMDRMVLRVQANSLGEAPPTEVRISARDVRRRAGSLHSLVSVMEVVSGDEIVGTGEGYLRVVGHATYRRLRADRPRHPPSGVSHRSAHPVSLTPSHGNATLAAAWVASIDVEDPFFFDHAVDHLPGMAIYEAACAVAAHAAPLDFPRIVYFDGRFHQFVELNELLRLSIARARPTQSNHSHNFEVSASWAGGLAMTALVGVSPMPPGER